VFTAPADVISYTGDTLYVSNVTTQGTVVSAMAPQTIGLM